jgi:hypothetical protein
MIFLEKKMCAASAVEMLLNEIPLYAASPRHKANAQMLQLWAFRCNRGCGEMK